MKNQNNIYNIENLILENTIGIFCIERKGTDPLWDLFIEWLKIVSDNNTIRGNSGAYPFYGIKDVSIRNILDHDCSPVYFNNNLLTLSEWYEKVKLKPKETLLIDIL